MKSSISLKERTRYTLKQMKKYKASYGFVAPFLIIFLIFTVVPVIMAMFLSFTDFNVLQAANFVAFGNYKNLFLKSVILFEKMPKLLI